MGVTRLVITLVILVSLWHTCIGASLPFKPDFVISCNTTATTKFASIVDLQPGTVFNFSSCSGNTNCTTQCTPFTITTSTTYRRISVFGRSVIAVGHHGLISDLNLTAFENATVVGMNSISSNTINDSCLVYNGCGTCSDATGCGWCNNVCVKEGNNTPQLSPNDLTCDFDSFNIDLDNCNITCFGKVALDSGVCNANGACLEQNTCLCSGGWEGSSCDAGTFVHEPKPACDPSFRTSSRTFVNLTMEDLRVGDVVEVFYSFVSAGEIKWNLTALTSNVVSLTNPKGCGIVSSAAGWSAPRGSTLFSVTEDGTAIFQLLIRRVSAMAIRNPKVFGRIHYNSSKIGYSKGLSCEFSPLQYTDGPAFWPDTATLDVTKGDFVEATAYFTVVSASAYFDLRPTASSTGAVELLGCPEPINAPSQKGVMTTTALFNVTQTGTLEIGLALLQADLQGVATLETVTIITRIVNRKNYNFAVSCEDRISLSSLTTWTSTWGTKLNLTANEAALVTFSFIAYTADFNYRFQETNTLVDWTDGSCITLVNYTTVPIFQFSLRTIVRPPVNAINQTVRLIFESSTNGNMVGSVNAFKGTVEKITLEFNRPLIAAPINDTNTTTGYTTSSQTIRVRITIQRNSSASFDVEKFATDLAKALGISRSRLSVIGFGKSASIDLVVDILSGTGPSPSQLAQTLMDGVESQDPAFTNLGIVAVSIEDPETDEGGGKGIGGAIAGAVVGGVLLSLIVAVVVFFIIKWKRNRISPLEYVNADRFNRKTFAEDERPPPKRVIPLGTAKDIWDASGGNDTESIRRFIHDKKTRLDSKDRDRGWTPLHHAADGGATDAVELLLKLGAKTLIKSNDQMRPVDLASRKKFYHIVGIILEAETNRRVHKAKKLTKLGQEATKMFQHYDKDKSQYLDRQEFMLCIQDLFKVLEMPMPAAQDIEDIFQEIAEGNEISITAFHDWWIRFNADDANLSDDDDDTDDEKKVKTKSELAMEGWDHSQKTRARVRVIMARNLMSADLNGLSDPYAKIEVGNEKPQKTHVIPRKTLKPEWNQTFLFPRRNPDTDMLKITVYDHDKIGRHEFLGIATVSLHELGPGETVIWKKLQGVDKGEVQVGLTLLD